MEMLIRTAFAGRSNWTSATDAALGVVVKVRIALERVERAEIGKRVAVSDHPRHVERERLGPLADRVLGGAPGGDHAREVGKGDAGDPGLAVDQRVCERHGASS